MKTNIAQESNRSWHAPAPRFISNAQASKGREPVCPDMQLGNRFRNMPNRRFLRYISVGGSILVLGSQLATAMTIYLTSGGSGSLTGVPQSYNETRAVDVTVLSGVNLMVESMTLDGFYGAPATIGARIYDTSSQTLVASADVSDLSGGPVTVPISAILVSGGDYRLGFYAVTSPPNNGSATLFQPDSFPYTETSGLFQINGAYDIASDSFPAYQNIFEPQTSLVVVPVPEPASMVFLGVGLLSALAFGRYWAKRFGSCATLV